MTRSIKPVAASIGGVEIVVTPAARRKVRRTARAAAVAGGYAAGIAATVYRELKRGETGGLDRNQRRAYSPVLAQQRVQESFKRRGKPAAGNLQGGLRGD